MKKLFCDVCKHELGNSYSSHLEIHLAGKLSIEVRVLRLPGLVDYRGDACTNCIEDALTSGHRGMGPDRSPTKTIVGRHENQNKA